MYVIMCVPLSAGSTGLLDKSSPSARKAPQSADKYNISYPLIAR